MEADRNCLGIYNSLESHGQQLISHDFPAI